MREKVSDALRKLNCPIVVVLDDIDRLSSPEIRDVFKLVRLTASFPNIIYILAFDRIRVEQALREQGISGRDYLDKILQYAIDLPSVPDHLMHQQINAALDEAIEGIEAQGPLNEEEWPDILLDIISPLIRTMRDVRRYGLAVRGAVDGLGGRIALIDLFALEAVRLFMPDLFRMLYSKRDALTTQSRMYMHEQMQPHIDELLACDKEREKVITSLLRLIFPCGYSHIDQSTIASDEVDRWTREKRVADDVFFDLYFERVENDGVAAVNAAERAVQLFGDSKGLESFLGSLNRKLLQDALASMDAVAGTYPHNQASRVPPVLLNQLPRAMAGELPGGLRINSNSHVARMVARFLLAVQDEQERLPILQGVLRAVTTLSAKLEVIVLLRSRTQPLFGWLPEERVAAVEALWREEVRGKLRHEDAGWTQEYALLRVLLVVKKFASGDEPEMVLPDTDGFIMALLLSARGEMSTSMLHSRSAKRTPTLAWEQLVEIFQDEAGLRGRIGRISGAMSNGTAADVVSLALQYAAGNAPEMPRK